MSSRITLKRALRRLGILNWTRLLRHLSVSDLRKPLLAEMRSVQQMKRRLGLGLAKCPRPADHQVLVIGVARVKEILFQAPLVAAFRLAGYEPIVLLESWSLVTERAYRAIGVESFIYHEDYLAEAAAPEHLEDLPSFEALLSLRHDNVTIGRYAVSKLMRRTRTSDPDFKGEHRDAVRSAVAQAKAYTDSSRAIIAAYRPDAALFLDHGYSPEGQLFDLVLESGGSCFTWNAAHRNGTLMLKRYETENRDVHPCSISANTWRLLQEMRWSESNWRKLLKEIEDCYYGGQWYGEVGTQFCKRFPGVEELKAEFSLDPTKKTAVIFPHIFWDATFFWGTDLFRTYKDWFIASLRAACANDKLNWVIKIHPGNVIKDRRDGYHGEHSEIVAIREAVGELPAHIRLIGAESDIGTLSLYHLLDYCLTVRGTVGIETAALGKRVITAGTGRFDRLGFTTDPDAADEYLDILAHLETLPALSALETEQARRYAYGVFIARPTPLSCVNFAYTQDSTASLDIQSRVDGAQWWTSPDVTSLARWITCGDDDYLNLAELEATAAAPRPAAAE